MAGAYFSLIVWTSDTNMDQFKDMLESLASSLSAGQNIQGAIASARGDLSQMYGEKSLIVKETEIIIYGMKNNLTPEELFDDFALRSGQKDIRTFADTFRVCNRSGGNMREVITRTSGILGEKMQTENDNDGNAIPYCADAEEPRRECCFGKQHRNSHC